MNTELDLGMAIEQVEGEKGREAEMLARITHIDSLEPTTANFSAS